jgi:valyl-tRNA synthetase
MVRDKQGRKMSKTLGNSPDLLELIDKFGADAVRFGIMISSPAGNDMLFDEASLEQGKLFNNKIWNALKLVKMWEARQAAGKEAVVTSEVSTARELQAEASLLHGESDTRDFAVEWFENRLNQVKEEMETMYSQFKLSEALKTLYSLIWDDFCSWYLEWVKPGFEQPIDTGIYQKTIVFFEELMQMLHPFMPFISEEIYHLLAEREVSDDLAIKQFAPIAPANKFILQEGDLLKKVISTIRDARNKNQVKPKDSIKLSIITNDRDDYKDIELILAKQVNADSLFYVNSAPSNCIVVTVEKDKFYFETGQEIDSAALKEALEKDLQHQHQFLLSVEKKLGNERFVANAKPEILALEQKKKVDALARIRAIEESLAGL